MATASLDRQSQRDSKNGLCILIDKEIVNLKDFKTNDNLCDCDLPPSSKISSLRLDCFDFLSFFSFSFDFSFFSFFSLSFFLSLTSTRSFSFTSTFSLDFSRFSLLFVGNLNAFIFLADFDGLLAQ